MGGFINVGTDVINAFLHGRALRQRAEQDLFERQIAVKKLEQDEAEFTERKRQFEETLKRLREEFKNKQVIEKIQLDRELAKLKFETGKEFTAGRLKPTEYDTSEEGIARALQGDTSPTRIRLSPNISFDIREFASPSEFARTQAEFEEGKETARQTAKEPFNLRRLVQQHRNASDLQDKRDLSALKRLDTSLSGALQRTREQISATEGRLDKTLSATEGRLLMSLGTALQRTREQIASREKIAELRAGTKKADKEIDNAVLVDNIREGRTLADNPVVRRLEYIKLFADNKVTPLTKQQFEAREAVVQEKPVVEKFIRLNQAINNFDWLDARTLMQELHGEIGAIATTRGGKLGILSRDDLKRLGELLPSYELAVRDKKANVTRTLEAVDIFNNRVKTLYSNLPEEHRDYWVKKHNMYISYGEPKTKYDLRMRGLIP